MRSLVWLLSTVLLSIGGLALASEAVSTSYRLDPATLGAAGEPASSAGYRLNATAAQPSAIGASSSFGYVLQSGFWGHVGSGLVPVVLQVERNAIDPERVDLSWSGNNAPYDIYATTDCVDVASGFFSTTSANAFDDLSTATPALTCFKVLATAPGPAPPPAN